MQHKSTFQKYISLEISLLSVLKKFNLTFFPRFLCNVACTPKIFTERISPHKLCIFLLSIIQFHQRYDHWYSIHARRMDHAELCQTLLQKRKLNFTKCITASGSIFHQLLAALKKRRKSPNLPKGLEPSANQVSNKGAPLLKRARPSWKGRTFLKEERPTATSNFLPSPHFNWTFPLHPTWPGTSFFYLHQQMIHPPSSHQGHGGTTYPSSPFEHGILWCGLVASVRPSNNITSGQTEA